jgi:hypothetical protein
MIFSMRVAAELAEFRQSRQHRRAVTHVWWAFLSGRVLLAGVFLLAAASKVRSRKAFDEFRIAVGRLGHVPRALAPAVVVGVVGIEFGTAVALLIPATAVPALVAGVGVLAAFTVVLERGRRTHPGVPCACFGSSSAPVGPAQLVRNAVLIGLALAVLTVGLTAGPSPHHAAGALVVAVFGGCVGALLLTRWDDLAAVLT